MLPAAGGGKKRLDLLVVTHEHKDHIAGFDPAFFENITIERIWMNAAMDPDHPQAGPHARAAPAGDDRDAQHRRAESVLSPELEELVALYGVDNDDAMTALRDTLPEASGITPTYVHAGMTPAELGLPLHGRDHPRARSRARHRSLLSRRGGRRDAAGTDRSGRGVQGVSR